MADVFLAHGARWYIGAEGYPEGRDALLFALTFLYGLGGGMSAAEALARVIRSDETLGQFRFFTQQL